MKYLLLVVLLMTSACATITPVDQKRKDILTCVKDLKTTGAETLDSFEVCRQVYELKKTK